MKYDKRECFYFERGAFFSGGLVYTIWELEDCMLLESQSYNDFAGMHEYKFTFPKEEMSQFTPAFNKISKWEERYEPSDDVCDGYEWEIRFDYSDFKFSSEGYETYPKGFRRTIRKLQRVLENLCSSYGGVYFPDESKRRMTL